MDNIKILQEQIYSNHRFIICQSTSTSSHCPVCGVKSHTKHSKYTRKVKDISIDFESTEMLLILFKFKCTNEACNRKIFVERLDIVESYQRKTKRSIELIKQLALMTSTIKTSTFIKSLGLQVSHDFVLRVLKKMCSINHDLSSQDSIKYIGIDDFAFKKGCSYGTLICDLETKKVIDVLPTRNARDLESWLKRLPNIQVVTRDGSITYAAAIRAGAPQAIQISDKFHLVQNLVKAVKEYIFTSYPHIISLGDMSDINQSTAPVNTVTTTLLKEPIESTDVDNQELEGKVAQKWDLILKIKEAHNQGMSQRQLAKVFSLSRKTIKKYINAENPIRYTKTTKRSNKLDPYKDIIVDLSMKGFTQTYIAQYIGNLGCSISRGSISYYMRAHGIVKQRSDRVDNNQLTLSNSISKQQVVKYICANHSTLTSDEHINLKNLKQRDPLIATLHELVNSFKSCLNSGNSQALDEWIEIVTNLKISELTTFINGLKRDIDAVRNAISFSYTNGLLEGMVNKVKVIKRICYGRCGFHLLRGKILNA